MSLYGNTDSAANVTKVESTLSADTSGEVVLFVDEAEALLEENRNRGIDGPGWWTYFTYTDTSGATRHKAEKLVALADPQGPETQADDATVADVSTTITFSINLAAVPGVPDPYTGSDLTVTAASSDGAQLTYQWQRRTTGSTRFTNCSATLDGGVYGATGAGTSASGAPIALTITGAAKADLDGAEYRVKITSASGAEEVISDVAALTFA